MCYLATGDLLLLELSTTTTGPPAVAAAADAKLKFKFIVNSLDDAGTLSIFVV